MSVIDYYSKKECSNLKSIFTDNCSENNCKLINTPRDSIILDGDEIEKCFSKIRNNSADRVIISNENDNNLEIIICDLSSGRRKHDLIKNKFINTAKHIVEVFNKSKFKIANLKCCYIGKYEKNKYIFKRKKVDVVKINGIEM